MTHLFKSLAYYWATFFLLIVKKRAVQTGSPQKTVWGLQQVLAEKWNAHIKGRATRGLTERLLGGVKQNEYSRGQAVLGSAGTVRPP